MSTNEANKTSLPTGAAGPGGGRGKKLQIVDSAKKNDAEAGNSNGGGVQNPNPSQSGPSQGGSETQSRRKNKRNNSGGTRTGYTPRAKMSKSSKPKYPAKFNGRYANGKRVVEDEPAAVEAVEEVVEVKIEDKSLPTIGAGKPGGGGGQETATEAVKSKVRGKKNKKKSNNGKIPSNNINININKARNVRDTVSQTLKSQPADAKDTNPPPKGVGSGPVKENVLTKIITTPTIETRAEAETRLDLERKSATKPPTPEREVEIEAELLSLSLRIDTEPEVVIKPSYASKLAASLEDAHSVLYLHTGLKLRSGLLEKDFDQVIAAVQDQLITMAMEAKSFPKWKWISWSDNKGLIAVNSEEDANFYINLIKHTRVQGSEQGYRLWKFSEFEERHLVTVTLTAALARLGEERVMDAIMLQNPLAGDIERASIAYSTKDSEWTIKFFADEKCFRDLLELRGGGQGRKVWLALGGGDVLAHLSRDPGVALAEAEARAKKKAEAVAAKARLRAEAKAAREGKPRAPDAPGPATKVAPLEGEDVNGTMEHSGTGDSGGGN